MLVYRIMTFCLLLSHEQHEKPPKEEGRHRWSSDVKLYPNFQERYGPQEKTLRILYKHIDYVYKSIRKIY